MVISNWHSIFVQLSVTALMIAAVMLAVAADQSFTNPKEHLQVSGRLMFWIGFCTLALTVISGFLAFRDVGNDAALHQALIQHRNWAYGGFVLAGCTAASMWRCRTKALPPLALILVLVLSGLVLAVAYKGEARLRGHGSNMKPGMREAGKGQNHQQND